MYAASRVTKAQVHSAFAVFGTLMHIQVCNGDDRAPTVAVKTKGRAYELACNSANVTFSRASDAAAAQTSLNGKSLLRADALKVTFISGGGCREDDDPERDDARRGPRHHRGHAVALPDEHTLRGV